ncbi:MAG: glutamate--tRNA ligase [Candidatus Marinimicrobia bacterium]|nr:glutamate--tRNA ligase [Candidatus Neomarinimicrobiota bacterium]MDD5581652.1 glutamate--tRNA ligase [Candidatus Neomarinimicrobiota bacterium]
MSELPVRVRFAPSPTGYLHIGGARTALFNYLYARNKGGTYLLRIEDTDIDRSLITMIDYILDALAWLGLLPDEPYVLQSENRANHLLAIEKLLKEKKAYRCFCSKETLDREKELAKKENKPYRYPGTCRTLSDAEIDQKVRQNIPYTVRLHVPDEGVTCFKDMVFKTIEIQNKEIDDFIIMRSDSTPVYQLAVVVDDAMMGITHVIRGEDHLSNTPKQILLYRALGYPIPQFAHVPLILAPDGKRLSKRHGATSVHEFREMGFIPDGFINGLIHLGWGKSGNQTLFTREELIQLFKIQDISKKSAIFDLQKMIWINGQHLSRKQAEELFPMVVEVWKKANLLTEEEAQSRKEYLYKAIDLLKTRMKLLQDFVTFGAYILKDPETYDSEAVKKYWTHPTILKMLKEYYTQLETLEPFMPSLLEETLRSLTEQAGEKAATLIHAVRLAITGFSVSPSLFDLLSLLGKETVLRRLEKSITYLSTNFPEHLIEKRDT